MFNIACESNWVIDWMNFCLKYIFVWMRCFFRFIANIQSIRYINYYAFLNMHMQYTYNCIKVIYIHTQKDILWKKLINNCFERSVCSMDFLLNKSLYTVFILTFVRDLFTKNCLFQSFFLRVPDLNLSF